MSYNNTNRGTIAKNERKTEDNHPDIAGSLNVNGQDFWINGWLKTNSKDGSKFYSLTVKPKEARQTSAAPHPRRAPPPERDDPRTSYGTIMDDEIPFAPEFR